MAEAEKVVMPELRPKPAAIWLSPVRPMPPAAVKEVTDWGILKVLWLSWPAMVNELKARGAVTAPVKPVRVRSVELKSPSTPAAMLGTVLMRPMVTARTELLWKPAACRVLMRPLVATSGLPVLIVLELTISAAIKEL